MPGACARAHIAAVTARSSDRRGRAGAALLVAVLHALALWLLLRAGAPPARTVAADPPLATFDVPPPPPPPRSSPRTHHSPAPDAPAPAGRRARRTAVVAPPPVFPLPPPVTVVAAPLAGTGSAPVGGAAERGDGSGAGGVGMGLGGGGAGGGGGTRARRIAGTIDDRDYPRAARRARHQGSVTVRFTVGVDGRARACAVLRGSGDAALDATTCRLIEGRFRYAPARDAGGAPVPEVRGWRQDWWLEPRAAPPANANGAEP